VRQERDAPAVDAAAEQLEHRGQDGDRPGDRASDHRDRAARDPVEDVETEHEHACHRDRDSRARDEDGPTGRARGPLERFVRREAAVALLARADHVEERVVHADGHADQEDDRLDAVVERKSLADEVEQAEGRRDGREREEHGDESRDDRPEREQEDEQGHGDGKELGPVQVVRDDPVSRVARRDVSGLLDRHGRVCRPGREHRVSEGTERVEVPDDSGNERGVTIARDPHDGSTAQPRAHASRYVRDRRAKRRVTDRVSIAVEVAVLARRRPRSVFVHEGVAARRLPDRPVL
jgi:hypothetical protein